MDAVVKAKIMTSRKSEESRVRTEKTERRLDHPFTSLLSIQSRIHNSCFPTHDPTKCTLTLPSNSGPSFHVLSLSAIRSPSCLPVFSSRWHHNGLPPQRAQSYFHSPHLCLCRLLFLLSISEFKGTPRLRTCTCIVHQAETPRSKATQAQVMGRLA